MHTSRHPVVAAFDFDGTLTRHDTLIPFLAYLSGYTGLARQIIGTSPSLLGYAVGRIPNHVAKERLLMAALAGFPYHELLERGQRFAHQQLPRLLREASIWQLQQHRAQGHRCVLVTASLELYVTPWANEAGFHDVLATRIEVTPEGQVTGRLSGSNCFGPEKVRRLDALLGARSGYHLVAYGDSRGDYELLAYADEAYYRNQPWKGEPA